MDVQSEYKAIIDGLMDRLETLRDAGVVFIPKNRRELVLLFIRDTPELDAPSLTRMIEAMGLKPEEVYITNALAANKPQLDEEIKKVSPKVIVTLGPKSALSLLDSEDVAVLRGRFHEYKGFKVMSSYDPASIVGKEDLRQKTWADMKLVMKELGVNGQKKSR